MLAPSANSPINTIATRAAGLGGIVGREFGAWLEQEGLQAIATRVSTGDECSIVIEDGYVVGAEQPAQETPKWKAGEF